MANGEDALKNFAAECDYCVERIRSTSAPTECKAYGPMSAGLVVLIRAASLAAQREIAEMERRRARREKVACWLIRAFAGVAAVAALYALAATLGLDPIHVLEMLR